MKDADTILIVGEIFVDYTLAQNDVQCKLRLGGIVHAARGLWAADLKYSVAVFCPQYLIDEAKKYLKELKCEEFIWLGEVIGAPNIILIEDVTEISHQGYEELMRDSKKINLQYPLPCLNSYQKIIVFPGKFNINDIVDVFSKTAKFSFDIAYDLNDLASLDKFKKRVQSIIISTSSSLFMKYGKHDINTLLDIVKKLSPDIFLLKENRGGSRLFNLKNNSIEEIPAMLSHTINSVGVGDVYSSVMVALSHRKGWVEAAWRGFQAATAYSQSTFPDDIKRNLQRELKFPLNTLQNLCGTVLPWHDRQNYSIYLAGPDFSYVTKCEIHFAISCLTYHNFKLRRPIKENGELKQSENKGVQHQTYELDYHLLKTCDVVFAVPLNRDPGTLVEIGIAIEMGKPVITYDPRHENENIMVVFGSSVYSACLDECLNGIFNAIAKLRTESK